MIYPTQKEIMSRPQPTYHKDIIICIQRWKKDSYKGWKDMPKNKKVGNLIKLMYSLNKIKTPDKKLSVLFGDCYTYTPSKTALTIDINNPSIISCLHELAHHFYGDSETTATRWSVWLFKKSFKKSWENLSFINHKLVKKQ